MARDTSSNRAFARLEEVTKGTILETDEGFTCLKEGDRREVYQDDMGLWVPCSEGEHHLDGQISEDGNHYVGFFLSEKED